MKPLFAQNLQYLRNQKKLSQSALAQALNYSRSNIASYEFGGSEPNIGRLIEISNFFNVSLDNLLSSNIEKLMYDNRIKDKPIKKHESLNNLGLLANTFKSDCSEIEEIHKGLKQFLSFKKKNWTNPDNELQSLIQEYEKLSNLVDYLITKSNEFVLEIKKTGS